MNQPERALKSWWNGKVVDTSTIHVSPFTHALHYGTGIFEGIRAYSQKSGGGGIFRLTEHIERFYESARILEMKIPFEAATLLEACRETCAANQWDECYLRPVAWMGDGPVGVNPGESPPIDVAILLWKWGKYLKTESTGARLKISSFLRPHPNATMTKGKITGNYVNSVLAKREAIKLGYSEAILLDAQGYVSEGSGENLFIVKEGRVRTPALTSILSGITRRTVIELLEKEGVAVTQGPITRDDLYGADEAFLVGTAAEITRIGSVDDRVLGPAGNLRKAGSSIVSRIQEQYDRAVRGERPEWITKI